MDIGVPLREYGRDPWSLGWPGLAIHPSPGSHPVQQAAEAWQALGCPRGLLLHGEALEEAERWAAGYAELGEAEEDFLQECQDAERHAHREGWLHSLLRGVVALAILSILVVTHGWWTAHEDMLGLSAANAEAQRQLEQTAAAVATLEALSGVLTQAWSDAEGQLQMAIRQARGIRSLALAAQSHLLLEQDTDLALLLAVQAFHTLPPEERRLGSAEVSAALHHALGHPDWHMSALGHEALPQRFALAWHSPDGRLLCAPDGDALSIWDAASGQHLVALKRDDGGTPGQVYRADWSHDGSRIAAAEIGGLGQQVTVWDAATGAVLWRSAWSGHLTDLAWSPDGSRLLLLDMQGRVALVNPAQGYTVTFLRQMVAGKDRQVSVNRAAWASDGRVIRLYTESGVYTYDVTQGDQGDFSLLSGASDGHSHHAEKTTLVWVSDSQRALLTRPQDLADLACARAARDMTAAEWARYMGADTPYRATCPDLVAP